MSGHQYYSGAYPWMMYSQLGKDKDNEHKGWASGHAVSTSF